MTRPKAKPIGDLSVWSIREGVAVCDMSFAPERYAMDMIQKLNTEKVPAIAVRESGIVATTGHVTSAIVGKLRFAALAATPSTRGKDMVARCGGECPIPGCRFHPAPSQQRLHAALRPLCLTHRSDAQKMLAAKSVTDPDAAVRRIVSIESDRIMRRAS